MRIYPFLFFLLMSIAAFGQNSRSAGQLEAIPDNPKQEYQHALDNIIIVKNKNEFLPLKELDKKKILFINIGMPSDNAFLNTMRLYTTIDTLDLPIDVAPSIALAKVEQSFKDYNLLILGIGWRHIAEEQLNFAFKLAGQISTIVFFGDLIPQLAQILDMDNVDAVLLNKAPKPIALSLSAQIIFGGEAPVHQISQSSSTELNDFERARWQQRLGYLAPEVLGVNGTYINTKIDSIVNESIMLKAFPGAQVLVAHKGKVIFQKAYGYHTYDKKRIVQLTDLYDYASVTKTTAALPAIMKLHGEGKFKLNATLGEYFPMLQNSNKAQLDFKNILAHQARLKPYIVFWQKTLRKNGKYKWWTFKNKKTKNYNIPITEHLFLHKNYKKKMYKLIKKSPLEANTTYKYSGLSFLLYPEMIAKMVGQDFEFYLKNTFYKKLGANSISFNPTKHFQLDQIVPTERDTFFRMAQVHGRAHDEAAAMLGGISGNAGLFSTANDLAKLYQMYLNGGTYGGERFIEASSLKEFTSCQFCETGNRRGLGFDKPLIEYDAQKSSVAEAASRESFGHSGYTGTFVWADPKAELLFIFFSNRVYPTRANRKIYQWNIRPKIMSFIYEGLEKKIGKEK